MAVAEREHSPGTTQETTEPENENYYTEYDLAVARALMNLYPELRDWATKEYSYGFLILQDIENPERVAALKKERHTSEHETGHKVVANSRRWTVDRVSIIQEGYVLGYTRSSPPLDKPVEELLLDRIAISFGGWAVEEANGISHEGCGSDIVSATYFASLLANARPEVYGSASSIIQRQKTYARQTITDFGRRNLDNDARSLQKKRVI